MESWRSLSRGIEINRTIFAGMKYIEKKESLKSALFLYPPMTVRSINIASFPAARSL